MRIRKDFLTISFFFIMVTGVAAEDGCNVINCKCDTAGKRIYDCVNVNDTILRIIAQQINNDTTDLSITGQNLTTFDAPFYLENLNNLDLSGNLFTRIPENLAKKFPKLGVLELKDNSIDKLEPEDFTGLSNLNKLRLDRNLLTEIKGGTFNELKNLRQLYADENQIETLSADTFSGASNLVNIEMNKNKVKSLPVGIFDPLKSNSQLKIELSGNYLTEIPNGLFTKLTEFQFILAEKNLLTKIGDTAFQGVRAMAINIQGNQITELLKSTFEGAQLQILQADDNPIRCQCSLKDLHGLADQMTGTCINKTSAKIDSTEWIREELCNECEVNNTCQHGGICVPVGKMDINCKCINDYHGKNCQDKPICESVTCQNKGTCKNLSPSNYTCECKNNYSGNHCEIFNEDNSLTVAEIVGIVLGVLLFFVLLVVIYMLCRKRCQKGGDGKAKAGEGVPLKGGPVSA